jgi:hypothetical protein
MTSFIAGLTSAQHCQAPQMSRLFSPPYVELKLDQGLDHLKKRHNGYQTNILQ